VFATRRPCGGIRTLVSEDRMNISGNEVQKYHSRSNQMRHKVGDHGTRRVSSSFAGSPLPELRALSGVRGQFSREEWLEASNPGNQGPNEGGARMMPVKITKHTGQGQMSTNLGKELVSILNQSKQDIAKAGFSHLHLRSATFCRGMCLPSRVH
jgi:hypothetical protein